MTFFINDEEATPAIGTPEFLLFAIGEAHVMPVAWVANRNADLTPCGRAPRPTRPPDISLGGNPIVRCELAWLAIEAATQRSLFARS